MGWSIKAISQRTAKLYLIRTNLRPSALRLTQGHEPADMVACKNQPIPNSELRLIKLGFQLAAFSFSNGCKNGNKSKQSLFAQH